MAKKELPPKVQFYTHLTRIKELRALHYPLKLIWETLRDDGSYTHPYSHFTRLAKTALEPVKPLNPAGGQTATRQTQQRSETSNVSGGGPKMFMKDLSKNN